MIERKEQKHQWYKKKLLEDPDYFRRKSLKFRLAHPGYGAKYCKKYYDTHPKVLVATNKWAADNPKKVNAESWARRKAKLKDFCENCGAKKVDGARLERHHPTYDNDKRADILTLCRSCHRHLHLVEKELANKSEKVMG